MRDPDCTETQDWHGRKLTVNMWTDPCDIPFDEHDYEAFEEQHISIDNVERWDAAVEVSLEIDGRTFEGFDSLCCIDFPRSDVTTLDKTIKEDIVPGAIANLEDVIRGMAKGWAVESVEVVLADAKKEAKVAKRIVKRFLNKQ